MILIKITISLSLSENWLKIKIITSCNEKNDDDMNEKQIYISILRKFISKFRSYNTISKISFSFHFQ